MKKEIIVLSGDAVFTGRVQKALENNADLKISVRNTAEEALEMLFRQHIDAIVSGGDILPEEMIRLRRILELTGSEALLVPATEDTDITAVLRDAFRLKALQRYTVNDGLLSPDVFTLIP
ncbi:MAG: hypothetical protein IBJ09_03985 [Bacteroidia bacterium]|nr:hypothetical protein [Bacteroidia bacterium]